MWVVFEAGIARGGGRRYFAGIHLGADTGSAAFSVIEQRGRQGVADPRGMPGRASFADPEHVTYIVRHLARWTLSTSYTTVVTDVKRVCEPSSSAQPWVVFDDEKAGGVDEQRETVIGTLKESGFQPVAVTLTRAGRARPRGGGGISVAKSDVIGAMTKLFEKRELKLASMITLIPEYLRELNAFHVSVSPRGNDASAATGSAPDDLILCTALPLWYAGQLRREAAADTRRGEPS